MKEVWSGVMEWGVGSALRRGGGAGNYERSSKGRWKSRPGSCLRGRTWLIVVGGRWGGRGWRRPPHLIFRVVDPTLDLKLVQSWAVVDIPFSVENRLMSVQGCWEVGCIRDLFVECLSLSKIDDVARRRNLQTLQLVPPHVDNYRGAGWMVIKHPWVRVEA